MVRPSSPTYVAGEYKTGGLSLLQVLTGVDDLSDMLNRLFYYGKVSDKQAQTIQEVKELKQQLTDKQAEQEKNVAATQKKVDELNAQQAEAQNVVNSLDSQLQAELAAEAEANAALQAGINASTAEKATVSNETAGTTENTNNGGQTSNNNNQGGNTPAPTPAPAPTPQPVHACSGSDAFRSEPVRRWRFCCLACIQQAWLRLFLGRNWPEQLRLLWFC